MFDKSFTAIYFLEGKILVAELDSRKKKVKKFVCLDIPSGLIKDFKVLDKKSLSGIIKGFWQKLGFKEKTVGLVIPEFSTYTKLLNLPKLPMGELNEAISWQAQEFLPKAPEDLIIDWKIAGRTEKGIEVLLVAIPKEILMGYVEVCELAGLFPIDVQTPSSSLINLTKKTEGKVLVLYSGFAEAVLVVSEKEKIIGTSVLTKTSEKEIFDITGKMLNHFGEADFKNIFIGGPDLNENFIKNLKSIFKKEILPLRPDVTGADGRQIQELLVPISMLMGDLKEPSDPKTLNLLPSNLVEKNKAEKTKIEVWGLTLTTTLFVWVSFLLVMGAYLVMSQQISSIKGRNTNNSQISVKRTKYQNQANSINQISSKILKIKSSTTMPEAILNGIHNSKPAGINLIRYKMDLQKGYVVLNGTSVDRTSLVEFKKKLEQIPEIRSIDIPIASFEKESNLEFQLSFQYGAKPVVQTQPKTEIDITK